MKIYAVIDTNVIVSALLSRFKNTSTVQRLKSNSPIQRILFSMRLLLLMKIHSL